MDTGTYKTRHTLIFEVLITVLTLFVFFLSVFFSEEVFASNQYTVSNAEEFNAAVTEIAAGDEQEATIALAADITGQNEFHGISGKKITITSNGDEVHSLAMHHVVTLQGDVVLDRVKLSHTALTDIFACGHLFETTANFEGFVGTHDYIELYGGGPEGQDVEGDTNLILRGSAQFTYVTGGGLNSNVDGSTHILIDDSRIHAGNLTGGGRATKSGAGAYVMKDTNIEVKRGVASDIFGGGRNEYKVSDKTIARVYGDTYVTTGRADADSYDAIIGTAMPSCAGSFNSTVNNTHFTVLPGTLSYNPNNSGFDTGEIFGAGEEDIVLGTVSIDVKGGGCGSRILYINGGSTTEKSSKTSSEIRNQSGEDYAIHITYENDDEAAKLRETTGGCYHGIEAVSSSNMLTTVNGDILVEIKNGDFEYVILDSEDFDSTVSGNSTLRIEDGRVAEIRGNNNLEKSTLIYDGCGSADNPQESGYLNKFGNVNLVNGAQVLIDSDQFPVFGGNTYNPFYNVFNMSIDNESALTTRNSSTSLKGNVSMDNGTWHALGNVYVYEGTESKDSHIYLDNYFALGYNHRNDGDSMSGFTAWKSENDEMIVLNQDYLDRFYGNVELSKSDVALLSVVNVGGNWSGGDSMLRLPAVETDKNYDGTGDTDIPINIDGRATGRCKVLTVTSENEDRGQLPKKPTLGDNYITGWKANGESDEVFLLENEDAIAEGLYLKRIADLNPDTQDTYYMWQVAKLDARTVKYEYKGDVPEGAPALPEDKEYYWRMKVDLEDEPALEGYTFSGWESEDVEITDKSQLRMATANKAFEMPDKDVTISGTWTKNAPSDPDDKDDPDSPDDKETPDSPSDPKTPDNPDSPSDTDAPDNPNSTSDKESPDSPSDQKTPDNPDSPSDTDAPDNPNSTSDKESPDTPDSQGNTVTTEDTDTADDSDSTSDSDTTEDSKDKTSTASKKNPKTSDDNDLRLYAAIMMLAILGETAVFAVRKRN